MSFRFSARSLRRMKGVHPDLVRVMHRAIKITPIDFTILEGVRSLATQRRYFAAGKSRTMNSRHLTGHAIDVAPYVNGAISWDWDDFYPLADAVKAAAKAEAVPVEWGGDWRRFKDGPHWQLPWAIYPKN